MSVATDAPRDLAPTPPPPSEAEKAARIRAKYRPDIDGIRGAAAIMVMGYHADVPGFEGAYIGLDLFFVVSGFVITGLLLREFNRSGGIRWAAFYARRARRLIPAKATMLVGVLALSYFVMTPTGAQQETARSAAAASVFVSNFFFWRVANVDYFGHEPGTGVLLHTWSLSVEEQFYLALPLVILVAIGVAKLLRVHVRRTLLGTALALSAGSLALAIVWADPFPKAAYYLPITRAFEFLLGVALALIVPKISLPRAVREVMGVIGFAIAAAVLIQPMPVEGYPSYWALLPCAATFLVIWAGTGGKVLASHFLSMRLLVGLGLVSYGWYLWHWPLLVMGESLNLAPPPLWGRITLVMIALGIAYLSFRFIEGIFYKRSGSRGIRTYGSPRVVLTGVTAMTTVAGLAGAALLIAQDQEESTRWSAVVAQLDDVPQLPSDCLEAGDLIPQSPVACEVNDFDPERPTTVLWGDSHAWMYIPAVLKVAQKEDVNLISFTMGGCPPFKAGPGDYLACKANQRLAVRKVIELKRSGEPVKVILSASWERYLGEPSLSLMDARGGNPGNSTYLEKIAPLFQVGGPELFEFLGDRKIPTDVIAPTPEVERNAPLCEAIARPYSCNIPEDIALERQEWTRTWIDLQMAKLDGDPRIIDVLPEICDDDTCYAEIDGVVTYFDNHHLSATFAASLSEYFAPSVRDLNAL